MPERSCVVKGKKLRGQGVSIYVKIRQLLNLIHYKTIAQGEVIKSCKKQRFYFKPYLSSVKTFNDYVSSTVLYITPRNPPKKVWEGKLLINLKIWRIQMHLSLKSQSPVANAKSQKYFGDFSVSMANTSLTILVRHYRKYWF